MSTRQLLDQRQVEEIRPLEPTLVPLALAFGIMVTLLGVAVSWELLIPGGILVIGALGKWVAEARNDYNAGS